MTAVTERPAALIMLHANSDEECSICSQYNPSDRKYNPDAQLQATDEVLSPHALHRHPAPFRQDDTP